MKSNAGKKPLFARLQISWGEIEFRTGKRGMLAVEPLLKACYTLSANVDFVIIRVCQVHL